MISKQNPNSENFFRWIFRRRDKLSAIVFIFVSKLNANNARFLPLFLSTENIRIVYFTGLPVKYSDKVIIKLFNKMQKFFTSKISKYQVIHFFETGINFNNQKQILHVDDPTYSNESIEKIKIWEYHCSLKGYASIIITTNSYTASWIQKKIRSSKIIIIEQGYHDFDLINKSEPKEYFICGYSSPYIDYGADKNADHPTYGAKILIDKVIPDLFKKDPSIKIYLIGKLGYHAEKALRKYPNVTTFGRTDFVENVQILAKCTIGIYPRIIDNKRSVLKIFTYMGAGIPIVTFDLIDTEIVKRKKLGFSVGDINQFIDKIIELKQNPDLLENFQNNVRLTREDYSWKKLAIKMESLLQLKIL